MLKQSGTYSFRTEPTHINSNRYLFAKTVYFCLFLISPRRETSAETQINTAVGKTNQACFFRGPQTVLANSSERRDWALLQRKLSPESKASPSSTPRSGPAETPGSPPAFQATHRCDQRARTAASPRAGLQGEIRRATCPRKRCRLNKILLEALILAFKNLLLA